MSKFVVGHLAMCNQPFVPVDQCPLCSDREATMSETKPDAVPIPEDLQEEYRASTNYEFVGFRKVTALIERIARLEHELTCQKTHTTNAKTLLHNHLAGPGTPLRKGA